VTIELEWLDPAVLSTAFLAGLLGSGHCFGMCGGIAAGLGALARGRAFAPALQFNLARLASYAILGLAAAGVLSGLSALQPIGRVLRVITAIMIFMGQRQDWIGRLTLGACWGLLPCGLVYTLLLTAAASGSAPAGAVTMLAFGAGTLPAMLGLTTAAPALATLLEDRTVRRLTGFALIVLALWTLVMMWVADHGAMNHAHH